MRGYCEPFKDKKITVMGLGLLGRAVGDVEFLATCGANVLVTDQKNAEDLAASVERLKKYPNISFHLGGHDEADFTHCDMVIKAAGVPLDSPYVAAARKAEVPVVMSTALFAKHAAEAGAIIVGVTGTRGKSTVAHMIYHSLIRTNRRAVLGGNIRGVSTLALLPEIQKNDICVLELDSWQLQGFGDLKISPHIALVTNLMLDHMNYYGGDTSTSLSTGMEKYFADKANIFTYQKQGDILLIGKDLVGRVGTARPPMTAIVPHAIPVDWTLKVPGEHNRNNASLAVDALRALGLPERDIKAGLESFRGVEGRLQFVRELHGVKIYNDNNATTPEATIAALRALDDGHRRSIILVAGGADKGLAMDSLISEIQKTCKKVILLAGSGTGRIKKEFPAAPVYDSLDGALRAALKEASAGDMILFSPALASFGMFKNEYDRNDQFLATVASLVSRSG